MDRVWRLEKVQSKDINLVNSIIRTLIAHKITNKGGSIITGEQRIHAWSLEHSKFKGKRQRGQLDASHGLTHLWSQNPAEGLRHKRREYKANLNYLVRPYLKSITTTTSQKRRIKTRKVCKIPSNYHKILKLVSTVRSQVIESTTTTNINPIFI